MVKERIAAQETELKEARKEKEEGAELI